MGVTSMDAFQMCINVIFPSPGALFCFEERNVSGYFVKNKSDLSYSDFSKSSKSPNYTHKSYVEICDTDCNTSLSIGDCTVDPFGIADKHGKISLDFHY